MKCRVYALGSNGLGQLGTGHCEDLNHPQPCLFADSNATPKEGNATAAACLPDGDVVSKLVAGGNHTIILTLKGHVYAAGNNVDGRCGVSLHSDGLNIFTRLSWADDRNITDIAATWEATILVEDARTVWTFGTGQKGELGLTKSTTQSKVPSKVFDVQDVCPAGSSILHVSSSMGHVAMLLSTGDVYGWGSSRKGQLGSTLQSQKIVWNPRRLDVPPSSAASRITTGRDFTLLLRGNTEFVLLGDFKSSDAELHRYFGSCGEHLRCMAGWSTIYMINDGRVDGFGQGRRGQLPPATLPLAASVAAGSEHCIALLKDGRVVAWGWGEHGNCGTPLDDRANVVDRFNVLPIPNQDTKAVTGVGAGCASTFIWSTSQE